MNTFKILETAVYDDLRNRERFLIAYATMASKDGSEKAFKFKFRIDHDTYTKFGREIIDLVPIEESSELLHGWGWRIVTDNAFMTHQDYRDRQLDEFKYELERHASMVYESTIVKDVDALTNI